MSRPPKRPPKRATPKRLRSKKPRGKDGHKHTSHLPEVCVLNIIRINDEGELIGQPVKWDSHKRPPHIIVTESGRGHAAKIGDRVLAKLRKTKPHHYHAMVIRVLPNEKPRTILGVFTSTADGGIIEPVSRKLKDSFLVARKDINGAEPGELVTATTIPGGSSRMSSAKINERLGTLNSPRAASLIAATMHELPQGFNDEAQQEAQNAPLPTLTDDRVDLRDIPLVTIDGEDARDFDDAVFAEPDGSGFHLIVAIADVAYYVKEDSALDAEAFERGNSVYFPDRVIPMLPEHLSNGLCSLNPNEDRNCVAVHIWIDGEGNIKRHKFIRALMRSHYRFTYNDLQATHDSKSNHPLRKNVIEPLFAAYKALAHERDERGSLDLDLPEYRIIFDGAGNVSSIEPRVRLEAHRLIEAFMIAANVAAADWLTKKNIPAIYRVHEPPADEKLEELRTMLKLSGYNLQKGAVRAIHFNRILKASTDKPEQAMVHTAVLRAQMQAYYANENLGHFGLSLQKYCHFTSPIRRYADLVVHRALISTLDKESHAASTRHLDMVAQHISDTERKAMMAEREASDRYKVSYMTQHIGNTFAGAISGLNEYGLYITLSDNGVTGFVPVRNLSGDFFRYDKKHSCFIGARTRQEYAIGMPLMIRVQEANSMTGSLIFEIEQGTISPSPTSKKHKPKKQRNTRRKRRHD
ncbi:MAG: ribonuclease R [Rickettsiales bacterium]